VLAHIDFVQLFHNIQVLGGRFKVTAEQNETFLHSFAVITPVFWNFA